MPCPSNPAQRRFIARMLVVAVFCLAFSAIAVIGVRHMHVTGVLGWLLALLPALPIAASLIVTGVYLAEEKDEFQRNLYIQAILAGVACTLALTTAWGYLEDLSLASHLRLAWVYPMFWIFVMLALPIVRLRYR